MPRPKNVNPTTPVKVYLSQENYAELILRTHSLILGKNRYGSVSEVVNEALSHFFSATKEPAQCTPPKPKQDSPNSEQSDKLAS